MLSFAIIIPLGAALLLTAWKGWPETAARVVASTTAAVPLLLFGFAWLDFDAEGARFQSVVDLPWIPAVGAGFRLGVDGIALAVAAMSALLFTVCAAYPVDYRGKWRQYLAWLLFLEAVSLGLFLALDLLLFYVFFDLSLVGMYFLIAIWGHEDAERAAIKFVLFTFAGSLVMLLGILSLVLATDPMTFDMRVLIEDQVLAGTGVRASLTLLALLFGLAVKTPLVPVHTWLPAAHVQAPGPVSALLAGVLLKMGAYGMIRVAYGMLTDDFRAWALWLGILAVVSIVYGALVALGQRHIKARIAYTSVTHMGYTILGIAAATSTSTASETARQTALTGATLEMVAHGLITGALFLLAGSLWERTRTYDMDAHGGVAARAPRLTAFAAVAMFASLGLPGLAGFVAEFQIFAGALAIEPWLAVVALVGVVLTAALFLQLLQRVFFGRAGHAVGDVTDVGRVETAALALLLALTLVIGVAPAFLIDTIAGASADTLGQP